MKLTKNQIEEINNKYPAQTMRKLASEYNVSLSTIQGALGRKKAYSKEYIKEYNRRQYDKVKALKKENAELKKQVDVLCKKIEQLKQLLNN